MLHVCLNFERSKRSPTSSTESSQAFLDSQYSPVKEYDRACSMALRNQ